MSTTSRMLLTAILTIGLTCLGLAGISFLIQAPLDWKALLVIGGFVIFLGHIYSWGVMFAEKTK